MLCVYIEDGKLVRVYAKRIYSYGEEGLFFIINRDNSGNVHYLKNHSRITRKYEKISKMKKYKGKYKNGYYK